MVRAVQAWQLRLDGGAWGKLSRQRAERLHQRYQSGGLLFSCANSLKPVTPHGVALPPLTRGRPHFDENSITCFPAGQTRQ